MFDDVKPGAAAVTLRALALITILVAVGLGAGCARPSAGGGVLRIASQKGTTRAAIEASHVLDGAPYRVEWSEFPSAQTLLEALDANAADIGLAGDAPFIFAYASGSKIKAVQALYYGDGSSTAIVVPQASPIRSSADLRGRKIATGRGSIGHYLLLRVLEQAHLTSKDVSVIYLAPGDAKAALESGAVDAWATWNPYVPLAVLHGRNRVLIDGRGLLHSIGFLAAGRDAIATKRPQLTDILQRLAKAYRWQNAHSDEFAAAWAKDTGLPVDVARYTVDQMRPRPTPIDAAVVAEERDTLDHFRAAGLIATTPDVAAGLDASFNDAVKP